MEGPFHRRKGWLSPQIPTRCAHRQSYDERLRNATAAKSQVEGAVKKMETNLGNLRSALASLETRRLQYSEARRSLWDQLENAQGAFHAAIENVTPPRSQTPNRD